MIAPLKSFVVPLQRCACLQFATRPHAIGDRTASILPLLQHLLFNMREQQNALDTTLIVKGHHIISPEARLPQASTSCQVAMP